MVTVRVLGSYGTESVEAMLRQMFDAEEKSIAFVEDPEAVPDVMIVTAMLAYPNCFGNSYLKLQDSMLEQMDKVLENGGRAVVNSVYRFLCLRERNHPNFVEFEAEKDPIQTLRPGTRAQEAALAAKLAAQPYLKEETIDRVIEKFQGIPGHFYLVAERKGVWYFDNSTASILSHTAMSLLTFEDPITLITGGDMDPEHPFPFGGIALMVVSYVDNVILYGNSADELENQAIQALKPRKSHTFIFWAESMEEAVAMAAEETQEGTACLFSPSVQAEEGEGA